MSDHTPRASRRMGDDTIGETPACTPIPQASSTATHRPSESPTQGGNVEIEKVEADVYLDGAIDGLKTISDMLHERNETDSQADSSLGILKVDELQDLYENEMAQKEYDLLELSDLAVDMRLRLQKELAQRTLERFSLASSDSNKNDGGAEAKIQEENYFNLQETSNCSFDDAENKVDSLSEFSEKSSLLESFHNPFDDVNLDSGAIANMAAIMVEFSGDEFIPGEKCEDRLLADESAWKKENIPPTFGPVNPASVTLDFSGIIGNAEISLASSSPSKQQKKRKVSVGEFFRLKSNLSSSFGLQGKEYKKKWNLGALSEVDTDELNLKDKCPKESLNSEIVREPETVTSFNKGIESLRLSDVSDSNHSTRDSLSLSSIAKILSNVDTCASPRTVVSNILKQSGLCKSNKAKDEIIPYMSLSTSLSNVSSGTDRILKDNSNIDRLTLSHRKLSNSYSNLPLIPTKSREKYASCASTSDKMLSESRNNDSSSSAKTHSRYNQKIGSDILGKISSSKISDQKNDRAQIKERSDLSHVNEVFDFDVNEQSGTSNMYPVEDSTASSDFSTSTDQKVDGNMWSVIQQLSDLPGESVDYSALKEKCTWVLPESGDPNDDHSLDWIRKKYDTSALSGFSEISVCKLPQDEIATSQPEMWICVGMPLHESHICLGVSQDVVLPISNVTERWILCGLELLKVQMPGQETSDTDQIAVVQLPCRKVLMDPNNSKEAKIKVLPLCEGKLEISVRIQLSDVVTKSEQSTTCSIAVVVEEPQIVLTGGGESDSPLNFGTLPEECAKVKTLTVTNHGSSSVPLRLQVMNEGTAKLSSFVLLNSQRDVVRELEFTLKPADSVMAQVMFAAPPLSLLTEKRGFVEVRGAVSMELVAVIPVELENISLTGCIGTTCLEYYQPANPVKLVVNEVGKTVTSLLPLKNLGLVPVTITPTVLPVDVDGVVLTVEPDELEVKPGAQANLKISLTATRPFTQHIVSALQVIRQPLGPKFYVDVIGEFVNDKKDIVRKKLESARILTPSSAKLTSDSGNRRSKPSSTSGHSSSTSSTTTTSTKKSSFGEKLNVRTTHRELVWGTVDVGKCVTKTFDVRSEEHFNIPSHIYVEDQQNAFKLLDEEGKPVTQRSITLRPMKNYTFSVVFNPQKTGQVFAKLIFVVRELRLILPLYGYGGHIRLIARGVPKDGGGRMWLMLYQHPHKTEWESSFCLRNLGNIRAFIKIKPISKGFQNVTIQNIIIEPSQIVIPEGETAKIKVKYEPQHKDLKLLMASSVQDVVELAALSLVSGDEATRFRLKRIHRKQLASNDNGAPPSLDLASLSEKFVGEDLHGAKNVGLLKDPKEYALDLYSCGVNHQEIILMLENLIDGQGVDASRAFQSMYQNVVDLSTSKFDDTGVSNKGDCEWDIVPASVTLHPPRVSSASVQLWTSSLSRLSFEANVSNNPPGFTLMVTPSAGFIPMTGSICLTVTCVPKPAHSFANTTWKGTIKICTENDMKQLNVCVAPVAQLFSVQKKKLIASRSSCDSISKTSKK